jgi:hypothetical protein
MVHGLANQVSHLFMGTGAFLDNLFYSPAENAPVFIGQVLCRQHDYRNVPPVSVGMNDRLPLLFRRSDNNL